MLRLVAIREILGIMSVRLKRSMELYFLVVMMIVMWLKGMNALGGLRLQGMIV